MPTISVGRDLLFKALGRSFTDEEFDELCFEYGIELDDVTTEKAILRKEKHISEEAQEDEEIIYKIEIPANRYDLLCLEGLARGLRIFKCAEQVPQFCVSKISAASMIKMEVKAETAMLRPFVVCAVLRGVTFNQARYNSFIDLQDKLHQNLCRRRTLVAIGTHDLDMLQGPFSYEALPPSEISFIPLKETQQFTAEGLMEKYKADMKLKKFLHILEGSPVHPVIFDSKRRVLSWPPIINGAHSAITLDTKNVFIECTATDLTKAKIVLNTMVTMFSEYCKNKFEVEPVEVVAANGVSTVYPDLSSRSMEVPLSYISGSLGVALKAKQVVQILNRMQLLATESSSQEGPDPVIHVKVPPTRSDILHPCDVMEDVGIGYGYNNIKQTTPKCVTQGKLLPLNDFSDSVRVEVAMAGFTEVLTWILGSHEENFDLVKRKSDVAVTVGNPRTSEFEVVRTSLLPGLLKTLGHNKDHPRPVKLFEVSDVVILDPSKDVGAKNERRLAALYCNANSGFEVIHGLVDRVMQVVGIKTVPTGDDSGYFIQPSEEPEFFPGRQASIICKGSRIGTFGIVHPQVLQNFLIPDPCSIMEINIEALL
ncbi:hypothetical protein GOP47_0010668 [Adiantum capillus-veneris]|uniref:phenylalanine--tRNA ligase n=1 Tax=Adiantum capillus-veneris TaxID=13818 RepID=A0A9D4ZI06_ADICA|nr:hypothetical protein GOP47_0010668 [Adiantum capillus-veneris]